MTGVCLFIHAGVPMKRFYCSGILICCIAIITMNCASPMVNLQSARMKKKWFMEGMYQLRKIDNHGGLSSAPADFPQEYSITTQGYIGRFGYGWQRTKTTSMEAGLQFGGYQHYHWEFPLDNDNSKYFPWACSSLEGTNIFYFNPFFKMGFNQEKQLKYAFVAELTGASVIVSYDHGKFTPYFAGKLAFTKYENPEYGWNESAYGHFYELRKFRDKLAIISLFGCELRALNRNSFIVEAGIVPHYFHHDNLYIFGFAYSFD